MKRAIIIAVVLFVATGAFAQIEKGDTEIGFQGYFTSVIGEDIPANGQGTIQLSYGKYVSEKLIIGVAPVVSFFTMEGQDEVETMWSGAAFFNYNFSTSSKAIPYLTGQFYQSTFDIPDDAEFTDFSYVNVGLGLKNFLNEYAAINLLATYGFHLAEGSEQGLLAFWVGLSFIL